ncbi:protein of unknown function [Candidatus Filomicrobium marinum]|uniref:Uncharacterized protein n=1 Tax=Candidatus Filomicrobium marinum TaxID=1608628 RepID=A0A0D6JLI5_9HYPH|nr:protein of unknown function [Candidatus Filomicrobium marinum]CPR22505.1 protein of unknown function [Candidatus Filomicrobium marinum]
MPRTLTACGATMELSTSSKRGRRRSARPLTGIFFSSLPPWCRNRSRKTAPKVSSSATAFRSKAESGSSAIRAEAPSTRSSRASAYAAVQLPAATNTTRPSRREKVRVGELLDTSAESMRALFRVQDMRTTNDLIARQRSALGGARVTLKKRRNLLTSSCGQPRTRPRRRGPPPIG